MRIHVHEHAKEDIRKLITTDAPAAAAVLVALEQLQADPREALEVLTTHGNTKFSENVRLNIKKWESAKGKGNLWRFRILDTPATTYRVVYGYHWQTRQICVFAVINKEEFDYDSHTTGVAARILDDWRTI